MAKKQNKTLAKVYHYDLYGKRQEKYDFLNEHSAADINWNELDYKEPYFFFVPKDFDTEHSYKKGFKVNDLLLLNSNGIETQKDILNIHFTPDDASIVKANLMNLSKNDLLKKYVIKEGRDWKVDEAIKDIKKLESLTNIQYRPFDFRVTFFSGKTKGIMAYPRNNVMKHFLHKNIGVCLMRQFADEYFSFVLVSDYIIDNRTFYSNKGKVNLFPLYLYPDTETDGMYAAEGLSEKGRKPNLNPEIVAEIAAGLGLEFENEKTDNENTFAPIDILDYIYAVLHSPTYREKYKEFLKIDFPRVPYPKDPETFWQLVKLGGEIRQIHLLESPKTEDYITSYPKDGSNQITRRIVKKDWEIVQTFHETSQPIGRIWINDSQYFDNIPLTAWEFYIGGYQPAQKWLKDRAPKKGQPGRVLTYEDILHYQKIIVALTETDRLMGEIDEIEIE